MDSEWDAIALDAEEEIWEPRVFKICELLRSSNMDLRLFVTRCLGAKSKRMREKQRSFIDNNGVEEVFEGMVSVINCSSKRKQNSATAISEVKRRLGGGVWRLVQQILDLELEAYCKQPIAKCPVQAITPDIATNFNFEELGGRFRQNCPRLYELINGVCSVGSDRDTMLDNLNSRKRKKSGGGGGERGRKSRNKLLINTVVMSMIAFGRSRMCNSLQTPIGYYLQACGVPKRVIGVLNRVGLSVGYTTICDAMKAMGSANGERIKKRIIQGHAFGLMWDNNVMFENKTGQSVKNQRVLTQYTCAAMWFLHIPKPEAPEKIRPVVRVETEESPEKRLRSVEGLDNGEEADGEATIGADLRDNSWREFDEKMRIYMDLQVYEEGVPSLDGRFLFASCLDYTKIDKYWLLSKDSYAEHMPNRLVVHLSDILWKYFPIVMQELAAREPGHTRPSFEWIHRIPCVRMDVNALDTLEKDETSIQGSAEVINKLLEQTGLSSIRLAGRVVLHVGDLGTMLKVSALKQLRVRDFEHNKLNYLAKLDGIFHLEMAAEDLLFRGHWGREDGMDPGSLCQLKHVLAVKGVTAGMPEYNTCKRFTNICGEGHALAAVASELKV
ncbi:hypothetical protein L211DRAFT_848511 [Terfezia boudieri ATCC MYA-4762]|uniref:DUF6589 domain-containing protein n=1 Tax=Terfezia boudieri ATCC MYA-4762 TaxID=1051890 RepID=A0A3N4M2Y5_9PEZI|nr:hypothetical protein L211DRAFT_848511 [Terfezia boudieri ATCC MYA-4762]